MHKWHRDADSDNIVHHKRTVVLRVYVSCLSWFVGGILSRSGANMGQAEAVTFTTSSGEHCRATRAPCRPEDGAAAAAAGGVRHPDR